MFKRRKREKDEDTDDDEGERMERNLTLCDEEGDEGEMECL